MVFEENLEKIVKRFEELSTRLASGITGEAFIKASKEYSDLEPVIEKITIFNKTKANITNLQSLIDNKDTEKELVELAQEEFLELKEQLPELEKAVKIALLPKDEVDARNAIIEIRAGTGGEEASLFAAELFGMYQRYSELKGWKFEILSLSDTGVGGFKEASALIKGKNVFSKLKFESGVHRVQRVPQTESSGRIHTSAATVAVLPEVEEIDIKIEDKDLRIDTYRSSGAGGQHVNTTDSAVRITHIPTGTVVTQQDEKSQHKNREKAMKILRARIFEHERQKKAAERAAFRKEQVGSGDRSEKVRTYNFPQGRVTDHRIGLSLFKIQEVVYGGELDEFIEALITQDEMDKLANI